MNISVLLDNLKDASFYTGVPDSQLKPLINFLMKTHGISNNHIIAANEGNCAALAAGYHLATGNVPVVYLQNSGIGNIINPVASLLNHNVYGIPCIFIIGWRGEPGFHDEPQHIFQGEITLKLLEDMDICTCIINKDTTETQLIEDIKKLDVNLELGKSVAYIIGNGAFDDTSKITYKNNNGLLREDIIKHIVNVSDEDVIISTTGKISRELFEIREGNNQSHKYDFLTVGSMGHCSSIALGVALWQPNKRVWCIDGDGAALMHMGSMAVIGTKAPTNLVHIVINNESHETVGGMPTVASSIDFIKIAQGCGYPYATSVDSLDKLDDTLKSVKVSHKLTFIEVKASIASRKDLIRPTISPIQNKVDFMEFLSEFSINHLK